MDDKTTETNPFITIMVEYSDIELSQLHKELLSILKEILRICDLLGIQCFVTGGTAIGARYFQGFVKWDDDIDLGMRRDDYEKFIKMAPSVVSDGYFIQCFNTEPNTPFYFAKVRKDGTLFVQEEYKDVEMHQGIFVDIFPFDNIPDNPFLARIHTRLVQFFKGSFLRRQLKKAIVEGQKSLPPCLSAALATIRFSMLKMIPKSFFYWRLKKVSSFFNHKNCKYVDVVVSGVDKMTSDSIHHLQPIHFEGFDIFAPGDIDGYLKNHYPDLKSPDMLESLWISHAPYRLSFSKKTEE